MQRENGGGRAGDEKMTAEAAAACRMNKDQRKARGRRRERGRGNLEERGSASSCGEIFGSDREKRAHCGGDGGNGGRTLTVSTSGSLASSASASRGCCSSGSDHEALFSQISQHLAGRDRRGGPDQFGKKRRLSVDSPTPRKPLDCNQEAKGEEEKEETLDPGKHSFSIALKECQNRRFRSESPASPTELNNRGRLRAASLDLYSQGIDVYRGSTMKKGSEESVRRKLGVFPSPVTPNYRHEKGWSSERVPLHANSSRRYVSTSALLPFHNGRTVPSKWEDAEKWIVSPMPGNGRPAGLPPHHRRPKSKSGPLATPLEMGYSYSSASPPMPIFDGGRIRNFPDNLPFLTGVLMTARGCSGSVSSAGGSGNGDEERVRSDLVVQPHFPLPGNGDAKDTCSLESLSILKKDVATQMSPNGSSRSSSKERPLSSPSSPVIEMQRSKPDIRDVQVDDRVTVTRWTKKNLPRGSDKSPNVPEWKKSKKIMEVAPEAEKTMSKIKRQEERIKAWENLQKAKAEASVRKLEMKLEKKRSSSMEKILKKLKTDQKKAQDMRNALTSMQVIRAARTQKASRMNSFWSCFACHVF